MSVSLSVCLPVCLAVCLCICVLDPGLQGSSSGHKAFVQTRPTEPLQYSAQNVLLAPSPTTLHPSLSNHTKIKKGALDRCANAYCLMFATISAACSCSTLTVFSSALFPFP